MELIAALGRYAQEQPKPNGYDAPATENFYSQANSGFQAFTPSLTAENKDFQQDSRSSPPPLDEGLKNPQNLSKTTADEGVKAYSSENGSEKQNSRSSEPKSKNKSATEAIAQFIKAGTIGLGLWQLERLGITEDTVEELIAQGLIEEFEEDGRRVRYVSPAEPNGVGDTAPNGAVEEPPQPASIEAEARRLKAANPSWSIKRIATELRLPEKRIRQYFAGEAP
jgi:hypothetical protein